MKDNQREQLFTELIPEEAAAINGGELNIGYFFDISSIITPVNLNLPDSYVLPAPPINYYSPLPPKKSEPSKFDVDKDSKSIFPAGGSTGLYGTTNPRGGGVVKRF